MKLSYLVSIALQCHGHQSEKALMGIVHFIRMAEDDQMRNGGSALVMQEVANHPNRHAHKEGLHSLYESVTAARKAIATKSTVRKH